MSFINYNSTLSSLGRVALKWLEESDFKAFIFYANGPEANDGCVRKNAHVTSIESEFFSRSHMIESSDQLTTGPSTRSEILDRGQLNSMERVVITNKGSLCEQDPVWTFCSSKVRCDRSLWPHLTTGPSTGSEILDCGLWAAQFQGTSYW
jgi:hypothetical protein